MARHASGATRLEIGRPARLAFIAVGVAAGVLVALFVIWITRVHGAATTGDEPWYLIESQALWSLHPQILPAAATDLAHHTFQAFAPGANLNTPNIIEAYKGPHGSVGYFEPGLPLILALPFNTVGELAARTTLMVLELAGFFFLHRRISLLTNLHRRAQVLLALMFAAPALLVAATQIYPDLLSGIVIAIAILEVALIEKQRRVSTFSGVVIALAVAILPWLQVKNLLPAVIVLAGFALVIRRSGAPGRWILVVGGVTAASWLLLVGYNLHYFGHLLGFPEPSPQFSHTAVLLTLGLLFGRDQGLIVQLPTVLVGVAGLWLARRVLPVAVVTSVGAAAVLLVLNGTYTLNPYGGYDFSGRFEWSIMPLLLAWTGWTISRWQASERKMWGPIILVSGAWTYQALPILLGHHTYYNNFNTWDPTDFAGWWPGLNRVLPEFDRLGQVFGAPAFGLPLEIALGLFIVALSLRYARPGGVRLLPTLAVCVTVGIALLVIDALIPPALPVAALPIAVAAFDSPLVGLHDTNGSRNVLIQAINAGTYRATLHYALSNSVTSASASGSFGLTCQAVSGANPVATVRVLRSGTTSQTVQLVCPQSGNLIATLSTTAGSRLDLHALSLVKSAA